PRQQGQQDVNGNSSFDKENENKLELTGPAVKQGPPVAPKPVWYRQSLKKIREEQTQKKTTKSPVDPPSSVGYSRSFGSRGQTSSNTNLSIRQKIHSFETFSSPESPEKVITAKRQVSTSSSLPTIEKETKVNCKMYYHGNTIYSILTCLYISLKYLSHRHYLLQ
uniref:Uncharacterized protein n=1 Tax=Periophthalmus magnuspinnatus TaxID=409849 RepID=A0A3B4AK12_9GOBI